MTVDAFLEDRHPPPWAVTLASDCRSYLVVDRDGDLVVSCYGRVPAVLIADAVNGFRPALEETIARQDCAHPGGYPATRDGVRLCLAAIDDELAEARAAHRDERSSPSWERTRQELLDVAAVAIRGVRSIDRYGKTELVEGTYRP